MTSEEGTETETEPERERERLVRERGGSTDRQTKKTKSKNNK